MPLVFDESQRKAWLKSKGYDPGWYDIDQETGNVFIKPGPVGPSDYEPQPTITKPAPVIPKPSIVGSAARGFGAGLIPSFAGLGGMKGGAMLGGRVGALGGPVGAGIGTFGGALAGGLLASATAAKIQDYLMPDRWRQTLAEDATVNPYSSLTGGIASGLIGLKPNISNIGNALKTTGKIGERMLVGNKLARPIASGEIANLANVGGGAGLGAAQSLYEDYRADQPIDPLKLLLSTAGGAVLSEPNKLVGQKIFGLTPTAGTIPGRDLSSRLNPEIANMLATEPSLSTIAPAMRNKAAMDDLLKGQYPEGYDVNIVDKNDPKQYKQNITENILPADLYEKGTPSAAIGGKLRKGDEIKPYKSAEDSARFFEEVYGGIDTQQPINPKAGLVLENQLRSATEQNLQERKPVTTPRDKATVREENYKAYKAAMQSGKFAEAGFYKQNGFQARLQAENRGETVKPFEGESNLKVKLPSAVGTDALGKPIKRTGGTYFQEETTDVKFDSAKKLEKLAQDNGVPLKVTQGIYNLLTKELGTKHGVDFSLDPRLKSRGQVDIETGLAKINPETATPDTVPHEVFHQYIKSLENSPVKSDKDLAEFVKNIVADSPDYRGLNARRSAGGLKPLDVEEFLTENVGYDAVRRLYNLDKQNGTFKSSWKDLMSRVKLRFGGKNIDDVSRVLSERMIEDEGSSSIKPAIEPTDKTEEQGDEGQGLKSDYDQYAEVQAKLSAKIKKGEYADDEFKALWQENETIKNRNGGMPPKDGGEGANNVKQQNDEQGLKELVQPKAFGKEDNMSVFADKNSDPKESLKDGASIYTISKSTREPGKWQRTEFIKDVDYMENGEEMRPIGHTTFDSFKEAADDLIGMNYKQLNKAEKASIRFQAEDGGLKPEKDYGPEIENKLGDASFKAAIDTQQTARKAKEYTSQSPEMISEAGTESVYKDLDDSAEYAAKKSEELEAFTRTDTYRNQGVAQGLKDQTETPKFKSWFGESKAVDKQGKPVKLYHGTKHDFTNLDFSKLDKYALFGPGFYMTDSPIVAGGDTGYAFKNVFSRDNRVFENESFNYDPRDSFADNVTEAKRILKGFGVEQDKIDSFIFKESKDKTKLQVYKSIDGSPNTKPVYAKIERPFDMDQAVKNNIPNVDAFVRAMAKDEGLKNIFDLHGEDSINDTIIYLEETTEPAREWYRDNIRDNDYQPEFSKFLKSQGFDGITHTGGVNKNIKHKVWIAFEPYKVKSAVGNSGEFNDSNPDIRFQDKVQGLTTEEVKKNITKNKTLLNKGFFSPEDNAVLRNLAELPFGIPGLKSDIDKLELRAGASGKYAAPKLKELFTRESTYNGRYTNQAIDAIKRLSDNEKDLLQATMLAEKRTGKSLEDTLPVKLKPTYTKLRNLFNLKQSDQINANQPVIDIKPTGGSFPRKARIDPFYYPEVTGSKQLEILLNKQGSEDFNRLRTDFVQHVKNKYNISDNYAGELFQEVLASYGGPIKSDSTRFGAVRKAEGIGLPDSWLETDMDRVQQRYWHRVAKDRSFHDVIESDDNMLHIMDRKFNPWGKPIKPSKKDSLIPISGNETLTGILDIVQGQGIKTNPRLDALSRIVNNLILGPITGATDAVNALPLTLKFAPSMSDVPAILAAGITNFRQGIKNAKYTGRIRENIAAIEDGWLPHSSSVERLRAFANTLSKISGRDGLETFSRGLSQAASEAIIGMQKKLAKTGDKRANEFLTNLANKQDYNKLSDIELASRIVDLSQGTYDVRGLPSWVINSPVAPILRLAKWNIEQLNNFHKHVVIPASKGNLTPLLTTMAGGLVGGMLAKELREKISNKKSNIPSWAEIAASDSSTSEKLPAVAYNLAAATSYSGIMGTLGELVKAGFDVAFENKPQGYNYPTIELLADAIEKTAYATQAIVDDEESPASVFPAYFADMLGRNIQLGRIGFNWLKDATNDPAKANADDRRELRTFRQLEGLPVAATGEPGGENPYVGLKLKKFKQSKDFNEARGLGKELISDTLEKYKDDPLQLKSSFDGMRRNNIQTVPAPERNPILFKRYHDYLVRLHGKDEANKKLSEYFSQRALNKAKSGMIPKF